MSRARTDSMTLEIPRTKFHQPIQRPGLLQRQQLWEQLQRESYRRVGLLCAPAGFGKTTLAASWLHETERDAVWLSLESSDDDPTRFCRLLLAGIRPLLDKEGIALLDAFEQSVDFAQPTFIASFLNAADTLNREFVFVLDDFHELHSSEIHDILATLVEQWPAHGHLLLLTRRRPYLPIARWLARDWLYELNLEALRFSLSESQAFLEETMGLTLSTRQASLLFQRTEGWVTGLQLLGLSLKHKVHPPHTQPWTKPNTEAPYLDEYLAEEILDKLPEHQQLFLLQTSILRKMCSSLCEALTGVKDSATILQELYQHNLFLSPIDARREWFQYHTLFAAWMQGQLERRYPGQTLALHREAHVWYAGQHNIEEAFYHAKQANDEELAASVLSTHLQTLLYRQEHYRVQQLTQQLSAETLRNHPLLHLRMLWAVQSTNRWNDEYEAQLQTLELSNDTPASPQNQEPSSLLDQTPKNRHLYGESLALRALQASQKLNFETSTSLAKQALYFLPNHRLYTRLSLRYMLSQDPAWLATQESSAQWLEQILHEVDAHPPAQKERAYLDYYCTCYRSWQLYNQGQLREAIGALRTKIQNPPLSEPAHLWGYHTMLSFFHWEANALPQALQHLEQATQHFQPHIEPFQLSSYFSSAALIHYTNAEEEKAYALIAQAKKEAQLSSPTHQSALDQIYLLMKLWDGDFQAITSWSAKSGLSAYDDVRLVGEEIQTSYIIYAHALLIEERLEEANHLLQTMLAQAQHELQVPLVISLQLSLAGLRLFEEKQEEALLCVHKAMSLASPGRHVQPFLIAAPQLSDLFATFLQTPALLQPDIDRRFLQKLQQALPDLDETPQLSSGHQRVVGAGQVVTLSKRELEVIAEVAEGKTYKEIAASLYISIETVKQHMKNIFQKLEVNNRTKAVTKARMLRML